MVQRLGTSRANATSARRYVDTVLDIVLRRKPKTPEAAEVAEAVEVRRYAISAANGGHGEDGCWKNNPDKAPDWLKEKWVKSGSGKETGNVEVCVASIEKRDFQQARC